MAGLDPGLDEELCAALSPDEDDCGLKDNPHICIYCQICRAVDNNDYCSASCAAMAERENEEDR